MNLFTSIIASGFVSMLLIPILMRMFGRFALVDQPNGRKVHTQSIPCCGGIGIAIACVIPFLLWPSQQNLILELFLGGGIILLFGLLDDVIDLDFKWKFVGQLLGVFIAVRAGVLIELFPYYSMDALPHIISYPLTAFFMIGVINAINFSDGLDGLAAGIVMLSLGMIALLANSVDGHSVVFLALAVMGSIIGFLRYNTYPAIVFMGDAGSQFLGYMTVSMAILVTQHSTQSFNAALPLLLLGLPILDTLAVMVQRVRQGDSLFIADKKHIHHKLLTRGFRHPEAVSIIYLIQATFLLSAYLLRFQPEPSALYVFAGICFLLFGFFYWSGKTGWTIRQQSLPGEFVERRTVWLREREWLPRSSLAIIKIGLIAYVLGAAWTAASIPMEYSKLAFAALCLFLLALFLLPGATRISVTKCGVYVIFSLLVHLLASTSTAEWVPNWGFPVYLYYALMTSALLLTIRLTRRDLFHMNPSDLLIILLLVAAVYLRDGDTLKSNIGQVALQFAILCYAAELLFRRQAVSTRTFQFSVGIGLVTLSLSGYFY